MRGEYELLESQMMITDLAVCFWFIRECHKCKGNPCMLIPVLLIISLSFSRLVEEEGYSLL